MRSLEKETLELLKPIGKRIHRHCHLSEKENQEIMRSLEVNGETFLYPGKENQELVRSLEEEKNIESLRTLEKESQEPLRCQEVENQVNTETPSQGESRAIGVSRRRRPGDIKTLQERESRIPEGSRR